MSSSSSGGSTFLRPLLAGVVRWWRRQSPSRQDRYATLGPLLSVLLFLGTIVLAFWYLRNEEIERETEGVKRDTEIAQKQIRLRLIENQEQLARIAREVVTRQVDAAEFSAQAAAFARERPEITHVTWLGPKLERRASVSASGFQANSLMVPGGGDPSMPAVGNAAGKAFASARERRLPTYSEPFRDAIGAHVVQLQVPLIDRNGFSGVLIAEYGVEALLRYYVPTEVSMRHAIAVIDVNEAPNSPVATTGELMRTGRAPIFHEVALAPVTNGLLLRGVGYRTSVGLISNTLFWMVAALAVLTVWMLLGTWRHMRRRLHIQNALLAETNFRRAMENSMLTGMRAMDLESRITYVNPAFCAMTGFSEGELLGSRPPYPHWPRDRIEENQRLLDQEMQGRSPSGGIEVKVMRKDGSVFDARMYVSPLVDAKGKQTGWMASMTNITEAKRVRDQLSASHERFTTVLEGLEAAVSVLSVPAQELLFANRSYRLWFSAEPDGHLQLAEEPARALPLDEQGEDLAGLPTQALAPDGLGGGTATPREVYVEEVERWFDVRTRYLQWTDGRLAQMLIATDITSRRAAEQQAQVQAEKAQVTSRLMTMGEMASSVAHELNQPLTAITNYCNGMMSRVQADSIAKEDLLAALEKTAKQAQRAAQVIQRIRAFVKRSEPRRVPSQAADIVEDATDLAQIEMRRRNVQLHVYVAQRLPVMQVDPILIEQVILNLLKNAAEAIDHAKLPPSRRHIELRVVPRHLPDQGATIEFSVSDSGPGLPEEVLTRMFEAFYSTKADGLGIGLGLCRSIVESHQGRLRVENLYNGETISGCRFSFTVPVDLKVSEAPSPSPVTPP